MQNVRPIEFKKITDGRGNLTPIEYPIDIPFEIKRIYYIYNVGEGVPRGFHSHKDLEQILLAVNGNIDILVKTPEEEQIIRLDDPAKGLYIGPMIWREMHNFSNQAVLLVLASNVYDEKDYLRDYNEYEKEYQKVYKRK